MSRLPLTNTMSSEILTPEYSPQEILSPAHQQHVIKPQRVLACVLCQQRKVKCDRKFPCANCTKSGVQCVLASLAARQRRRRFPERELLDRLRHYEDLLRQNNIAFDPLHPTRSCDRSCENTNATTQESRVQPSLIEPGTNDPTVYKAK